jgi:hypothetical protein
LGIKNGATGSVYLDSDIPILFDIYKKYNEGEVLINELFDFYVKNKKKCFSDTLNGIYPDQTVGSYIAHFGNIDLLKIFAEEQVPINSKKELPEDTALFNLASALLNYRMTNQTFGPLKYSKTEKLERLNILLDAGADATLLCSYNKGTIFHVFKWYPEEEDFTEVLNKMLAQGANIKARDSNGNTAIFATLDVDVFNTNAEYYISYLLTRQLLFRHQRHKLWPDQENIV